MSTRKRWTWTGSAVVFGLALLAAQTLVIAQERPAPPEDGKALAERIGLTGDAAGELEAELDRLADALAEHARMHEEVAGVRTDLHAALAEIVPTLTPGQRGRLHEVMMESRGTGAGMGSMMGADARSGMGAGMHRGMASGMHRGMGAGMVDGCPFYQGPATSPQPEGSGGGPGGR